MEKRKSADIQKLILDAIKKNSGITLSALERKIKTNPAGLKQHCEQLERLGLVKINKTEKTTILMI